MTTRLLVALSATLEAHFVTTIGESRDTEVARRCADVADLLAAAAAGVGDCAAVSADLPQLDRDVIDQLDRAAVDVLGVVAPGDEAGERRLRHLGLQRIITSDASAMDIDAALAALSAGVDEQGTPVARSAPDLLDPDVEAVLDRRLQAALDGDLDALSRPSPDSTAGDLDDDAPGDGLGRIVAVWGPIGSPGRTTVAITVAAELAAAGVPTLLIDADTYAASVAQSLGLLDDTPGLAAVARAAEQGTLDVPVMLRRAPEVSDHLRVLTGLPRADRWPEVRDGAMQRILDVARHAAEVVIVDCGFNLEADEELSYDTTAPRRNATTLTTLGEADSLLVVGAGDPVGVQRLVRALGEIGQIPSPPPQVIVTKVRAAAAGPRPERAVREVLARFSAVSDLVVVPDDRAACDASLLAGRTLIEEVPTSPIRFALAQVAAQLAPGRVQAPTSRRGRRR